MSLVELLTAVAILALLAALARPALDGVTARWRLRGAARGVECVVRWAQNAAATRGQTSQVLYDVTAGQIWVRAGDESFAVRRLPEDVRFDSVEFADGTRILNDVAAISAYPEGSVDSHAVTLVSRDATRLRLEFKRLTGEVVTEEDTGEANP